MAATGSARHKLIIPAWFAGQWSPSRFWLVSANRHQLPGKGTCEESKEIMNILEAYDLTGSFRDVGELTCQHPHRTAHVYRPVYRVNQPNSQRRWRSGIPPGPCQEPHPGDSWSSLPPCLNTGRPSFSSSCADGMVIAWLILR